MFIKWIFDANLNEINNSEKLTPFIASFFSFNSFLPNCARCRLLTQKEPTKEVGVKT